MELCTKARLNQEAGRESVVWSGASKSVPIKARTDRTNPSVWRKGKPKTSRRINAVSIATSENRFCPPGRPEGDGRHASVAAAESHRVTSPRWTSARSYSRQFPTRYVVLYFGCTFDFISRIVRWPRPQDQPVDDARRSKGQEPCTKAASRRHSAAMLSSPRSPSRTIRIFSSAETTFV